MTNEAHIRADDGVKRPKHPQKPAKRAKEGQSWTIPDGLNPDEILMRYLTEGKTSGIALEYGVRRGALTRWLSQVRPKEWKQVQVIRALCTKEDGQEYIYDATTGLQLARARALVDSAQWDLERLDSANYGQKQEVTITDNRDLGDRLRRARERVIEHSVAPMPQIAPQQGQVIDVVPAQPVITKE